MTNLDLVEANALFILKEDAKLILKFLKDRDLISSHLKIDNTDTELIVPLEFKIDLNIIQLKSHLMRDIKQSKHKFRIKKLVMKSISDILSEVIPIKLLKFQPTAYDQIGSIAIIDLKNEIIEYKYNIGNAIMKLHPGTKSVFRKSKAVSGITRLRGLELIAGVLNYETVHREYGLNIFVNLEKVYFSPRLSTEHRRIAEMVGPNEIVLDMFGAAAPFGLHITQLQTAIVYTLDINENTTKIISKSLELNKRLKGEIVIHTGDAKNIVEKYLEQGLSFDRIIMNHPSNALKYLKDADKVLKKNGIIHMYSFIPMVNHDNLCKRVIMQELKDYQIFDIHKVRQYSPDEYHTCITIKKL